MTPPGPGPTLLAAADLRDALAAHARGDTAAALGALMSIDAESWQAIHDRLSQIGGSLPELLAAVQHTRQGQDR